MREGLPVDADQEHGTSVVGLRLTPENMIANFGTATGVWIEENRLLNITEFAEKPTLEYARNSLGVARSAPRTVPDRLWAVYSQTGDL